MDDLSALAHAALVRFPKHCPTCGESWRRLDLRSCDECKLRGVVGERPCKHIPIQYTLRAGGPYPWTGGRKGLFCMGCHHPPR